MIYCSGALFYATKTSRFLLLHRTQGKNSQCWGLVGGSLEGTETAWEGLLRETAEEIGFVPDILKTFPLEKYVNSKETFEYNTYLCIIKEEFIPQLNKEHNGYTWCSYNNWPKPLHRGLQSTFNNKVNRAKIDTVLEVAHYLDKI